MADVIADSEGMRDFGAQLAGKLHGGDIVVLTGALGAGKTTLVQGLARGLGISDAVTSPTFVVERRHKPGDRGIGLVHVDAYRLAGAAELRDLELDDHPGDVVVVEWGAPYAATLGPAWVEVVIDRAGIPGPSDDPAGGQRTIEVTWHGQEART